MNAKKIVILGAAESGVGAALLAKQEGYDVWVSDSGKIKLEYKEELEAANIAYEEGTHTAEKIFNADLIVKSPGIPEKVELIKALRLQEKEIISEIEFAYLHKGDGKIIAITGSNGKTTTTSLTYHILKDAGYDVALVGNVGYSFAKQIAVNKKEWYVLEVSSFQLDDIKTFKPNVAIITNITEDHLDRYDFKVGNYIASKFRIIKNQTEEDVLIWNMDDETTAEQITKYTIKSQIAPITMKKEGITQGGYLTNAELHIKWKGEEVKMSIEDFAIKGKHNKYNTMAASMAAIAIGIRKEKIRDALQTFQSLEHRMEPVATIRGIEFINDSKATNINSTWYALESMDKPTVLILGGVDKGNDYSLLQDLVKEKVKAIVCLGIDNQKIHESFQGIVEKIVDTDNADDAAKLAYDLATKGDVVLLSPACASFDLFKNYEDRGEQFKIAVKNL